MSIRDQAKLCFQKGKFVAAAEACACTRLPWAPCPIFVSGPQSARSACARVKRREVFPPLTHCACAADTEAITQEPEAAALYQNRALW